MRKPCVFICYLIGLSSENCINLHFLYTKDDRLRQIKMMEQSFF